MPGLLGSMQDMMWFVSLFIENPPDCTRFLTFTSKHHGISNPERPTTGVEMKWWKSLRWHAQELREWIKTTWFEAVDGVHSWDGLVYHGWNSMSRISDFEANMLYLLFVRVFMKDLPISIGAGVCSSRVRRYCTIGYPQRLENVWKHGY